MRRFLKANSGALALLCVVSSNASAKLFAPRAERQHVAFDMPTVGPFAYTHFCLRYPDDCRIHNPQFRRPKPVVLNEARGRELLEVNRNVNALIRPKRYVADVTFDTWRLAPPAGDCNDYAVTKRHELLTRGWPSRALLLTEVITSWGEHHLVLLVRLKDQDMILDNLHANPTPWFTSRYKFVRAQSPFDATLWTTIRTPGAPAPERTS